MKYLLSASAAFLFAVSGAAADPAAVRSTISGQLDAFRNGDAAGAYGYAAPSIKEMFPTPERFARMVERGYGPIYDGEEPVFLDGRSVEGGDYAQEVRFTDDMGRSWTALYTLSEQPDGRWRITGCYLREPEGASA